MALNAHLTLEGTKSGKLKGSVQQQGREDSIMVIAVEHVISAPRDAASGQASGKRQHKPLTITKWVDKSSPILFQILVTNEVIKTFKLDFYQTTPEGAEEIFYTIELENASISEVKLVMLNNKYPDNMQQKEQENVSFTYQKITWTFQDGGISASDDWLGARS
jgi:type VI secretion system secreted protein Hcp